MYKRGSTVAVPGAFMDRDESGDGAGHLDQDFRWCVGLGSEGHELDTQQGDLRDEAPEDGGLIEGFLLLRGKDAGVEAVLAGVPVARLRATTPL